MNKRLLILALIGLMPVSGYAQDFDSDIDAELDSVTSAAPQYVEGAPTGAAIAPQGGSMNGSQPIYILNQATPTSTAQVQQTQVQKQPQVDILAAPLTKSRAEQIRDARQQAEVETENKIVEKLEASRMEDERRRAALLFDQPFNNVSNQQAPPPQPVQPVQVQYVQAPPVVEEKEEVDIRSEIRAALKAEQEIPEATLEQKYFGAILGIGEYPDVGNVRGNYVLGAQFGTKFDESYAVEGSFTFSDYTVDTGCVTCNMQTGYWVPALVNVQQYSGSLAVKYLFLNGMVKPVFGGLVQYSYRTFSWSNDNGYGYQGGYGNQNGFSNQGSSDANSHAVDIGIVTGADIEFNKKWSLGVDFKYMWNLANRVNINNQAQFLTQPQYGTPIEKLQYYTMSIVGRVNF